MAVNGFDFGIAPDGELLVSHETGDIKKISDNDLKLQLAMSRLKSCVNEWFYDEVGVDMEELVGRPLNERLVDVGTSRIIEALTFDELWDESDIFIQPKITDTTHLAYYVYLRIRNADEKPDTSQCIITDLDLVKGVKIRYGWDSDNRYWIIGEKYGNRKHTS